MSRPHATSLAVGFSAVVVLAAGCGSSKPASRPPPKTPAASTTAPANSIAAITVSAGVTPKVTLPSTPFAVAETSTRVITAGTGPVVAKGQNVTLNVVLVDGRDGTQALSDFGHAPEVFLADPAAGLPAIGKGAIGQHVGSRVLVAATSDDGFGTHGDSQIGIQPGDPLVLLLQIVKAHTPLPVAAGKAVAPVAGQPRVTSGKKPSITVPKRPAPKTLIAQPLVTGTGAKVAAGQTVTVEYTGVIWTTGKVFDSSWARSPTNFVIGKQQVIPGWDKGLVGRHVGDRVLLVVPPADGYGASGQGPIKGTDTLVFAIDILDAN
ncbi:MAG: FKBP-type peptidyl-prolyl cis-trans isomerase [Mycobacteriales bacterium]